MNFEYFEWVGNKIFVFAPTAAGGGGGGGGPNVNSAKKQLGNESKKTIYNTAQPPYRTLQDTSGPYRTLQDLTGPDRTSTDRPEKTLPNLTRPPRTPRTPCRDLLIVVFRDRLGLAALCLCPSLLSGWLFGFLVFYHSSRSKSHLSFSLYLSLSFFLSRYLYLGFIRFSIDNQEMLRYVTIKSYKIFILILGISNIKSPMFLLINILSENCRTYLIFLFFFLSSSVSSSCWLWTELNCGGGGWKEEDGEKCQQLKSLPHHKPGDGHLILQISSISFQPIRLTKFLSFLSEFLILGWLIDFIKMKLLS